ncbi:antitoxin Xre/MbcA/ParS toxin-binding domain-containing protein [Allohahella sp. A8]|uniref:antitoxin Xre/MbcA/ParS toxin-binding domain-containing protein n=1 Tax=Allohahella sp. A8 TaxID=3141461 RepID=UPI003A7F8766
MIFEANRVWGGLKSAKQWLSSPVPALDGERPIDLFDTFEGRRWVTTVLRHIETGDFS